MINEFFRKFAHSAATLVGTPGTFLIGLLVVTVWAISGPFFGFSDTWQLIINTGTTVVTFLMVFLIQNTQNRDAKAMHLKLDELIRSVKQARNGLIDLEELSDEELIQLQEEFHRLRARAASARQNAQSGQASTATSYSATGSPPDEPTATEIGDGSLFTRPTSP
jgi:low affinity Fe/Cu permease